MAEGQDLVDSADFLGLLGDHLGDSVEAVAARGGWQSVVAPSGLQGQVKAAQMGLFGDAGMGGSSYFLVARYATNRRLTRSDEAFGWAMSSRAVMRSACESVITDGPFCLPHLVALDNRECLPPLFPASANPDGWAGESLLGHLLSLVGDSRILHLPYAVFHDPPEDRSFTEEQALRHASQISMHDVCAWLVGQCSRGAGVETFGDICLEKGSLSEVDFDTFLSDGAEAHRVALRTFSQNYYDSIGARSPSWASAMADLIYQHDMAASDAGYRVPAELKPGRSLAEAKDLARQLLLYYGKVLKAWPTMFAASKTMRTNGVRIGIPL